MNIEDLKQNQVVVEIPVQKSYFYPILIGENTLDFVAEVVRQHTKAKKVLMVTNETVFPLYGKKIENLLKKSGFEVEVFELNDGEKFKNTSSLEKIWEKAIEIKLERKDAIVALGGGVVGDIAGFAAATYLRGIDFVQIPTTLLSQVDSSVGGKVAVNSPLGKNLIGNFYQPKAVLTDIATLKTLSERELKVGLAEVLKYALIENSCGLSKKGENFAQFLTTNKDKIFAIDKDIIAKTVKYCCELKASVVNQDEKEAGLRAILNFGHTIGHAVEKCCRYEGINHGEAIAIGMKGALHLSKKRNLISEEYYDFCLEFLNFYGMNYKIAANISSEDLCNAMLSDKKVQSGKTRFVLPVGDFSVKLFDDVSKEDVLESLKILY